MLTTHRRRLLPVLLLMLAAYAIYGGHAALAEYPPADSGTAHTVTPADFELLDNNGLQHSCAAVICPGTSARTPATGSS